MNTEPAVSSSIDLRQWSLRDAVIVGTVMITANVAGTVLPLRVVPILPHGTSFQQSQVSLLFTLALAFVATGLVAVAIRNIRTLGDLLSSMDGIRTGMFGCLCRLVL